MRKNPTTLTDVLPIVLGGTAVAVAIVLLARRSQASQQQGLFGQGNTIAFVPTTPLTERPASHVIPPPAPAPLVSLLRSSETARRIFAYQAFLFSYGYTTVVPDGRLGDITRGWIRDINRLWGDASPSNAFTSLSLLRAVQTLRDRLGRTNQQRLLPFSLPQDVITSVNNTMLAQNPGLEIGLLRADAAV